MRNFIVNDFLGALCKYYVTKLEKPSKTNNSSKINNVNISINLGGNREINRIEPFGLIKN